MCIIYIYKHRICQALLPSTFAKHFCQALLPPCSSSLNASEEKTLYIYIQYT